MPTIKQVATVAGVSFKTVSRVINNDPNVSDFTRERVREAIRELGYRPNYAARHMRTQRSHVIGLITDEIATTPFAVNLIRGAQNQAWHSDWVLMVMNTEGDEERTRDAVETLLARKVEGILYATMRHRVIRPPDNLYEVPAVLANCRADDPRFASVAPDEAAAGFTATEVLLHRGHRRIALINLEPEAIAARGRFEGYRRALNAYQVPLDTELIRYTRAGQPDDGYEQACALLALAERPTAIFCANDRIAMGAYEAVKERGLRIPHDIAIIGFDNQEVIAAHLRPALSTMALPHEAMGRWAVEYLRRAARGEAAVEHLLLPCPYIERFSV